ncbi:hypothetical protein KCP77_15960 [Salmonella enterica subsp. enterica]|nr:hypothetical protein KCP77_15960 [Salmonella enterica subsp. enterica]
MDVMLDFRPITSFLGEAFSTPALNFCPSEGHYAPCCCIEISSPFSLRPGR